MQQHSRGRNNNSNGVASCVQRKETTLSGKTMLQGLLMTITVLFFVLLSMAENSSQWGKQFESLPRVKPGDPIEETGTGNQSLNSPELPTNPTSPTSAERDHHAKATLPSANNPDLSRTAMNSPFDAQFVSGTYQDPNWSRPATLHDSEPPASNNNGTFATTTPEQSRLMSEVDGTDTKQLRVWAKLLWDKKRLQQPAAAAAFKRCLGTRTWFLIGDSHMEHLFKHIAQTVVPAELVKKQPPPPAKAKNGKFLVKLPGAMKKRRRPHTLLGPFSKKSANGGYIVKVHSKFLKTSSSNSQRSAGEDAASGDDAESFLSLDKLVNITRKKTTGSAANITHVMIGTGAWQVLMNNTHPYDLYWRIRTFVKDLRAQLQNVTLIGYIPHYYQEPTSFRKPFIPCASESRILAMREASLAAYAAEKVDWIVDAWHLTKAHPDASDKWGHHYFDSVNLLIVQDILNTIFKCGGSDDVKEEIDFTKRTGNGLPGAGGQFFTTGPKVTRIFRPHQVRIQDRFVKPGTDPADGVEDRDAAEGARVPWPEMRICECNQRPFYEVCELMQPIAGLGAKWYGKTLQTARWRIARHYCELGKKQLESSGALPVRPLDQTRTLANTTYNPQPSRRQEQQLPTSLPFFSPFPNHTLIQTATHLTTPDRWDHFLALACDNEVLLSEFRNCAVNIAGDVFKLVNNWNLTDVSVCKELQYPAGKMKKKFFRSPSTVCPSVKVGCANNDGR